NWRGRAKLKENISSHLRNLQKTLGFQAHYPGPAHDKLFEASYRHLGDAKTCEECGCNGDLIPRRRFETKNIQPAVHFGIIASGDTAMKSGKERDKVAKQESIIGFEMEGAGVWDTFPCIMIKGACDYADSHKTKVWQPYAAAIAAACAKGFLEFWEPLFSLYHILAIRILLDARVSYTSLRRAWAIYSRKLQPLIYEHHSLA
ncbi:unnamed protein product, partial [Clonostachys solani]